MGSRASALKITPLGINLHITDVDDFFYEKIRKKLFYWASIYFSLTSRILIVNSLLLSSLWFSIMIWGRTLNTIRKIRGHL
jgi:hypothetical protein